MTWYSVDTLGFSR